MNAAILFRLPLASSTIAKLTNNQNVNTAVLCRICEVLDCDFKDIVSFKKDDISEVKENG